MRYLRSIASLRRCGRLDIAVCPDMPVLWLAEPAALRFVHGRNYGPMASYSCSNTSSGWTTANAAGKIRRPVHHRLQSPVAVGDGGSSAASFPDASIVAKKELREAAGRRLVHCRENIR